MRKWKLLKLTTLALLTALLAWFTYPTWESLIIPGSPTPTYSVNDEVNLIAADSSSTILTSRVEARPPSSAEATSASATITFFVLSRDSTYGADSRPGVGYIRLSGRAEDWLESCEQIYSRRIKGAPLVNFGEISNEALPSWARINELSSRAYTYFQVSGELQCAVSDKVWSTDEGRYRFAAPVLSTETAGDSGMPLGAPKTTASCVSVSVGLGAAITTDYRYPVYDLKAPSQNDGPDESIYWEDCRAWDKTNPRGQSSLVQLPIARLTDNDLRSEVERNLFFAGVFAALLGALAIELVEGGFEVAEAGADRRNADPEGVHTQRRDPEAMVTETLEPKIVRFNQR